MKRVHLLPLVLCFLGFITGCAETDQNASAVDDFLRCPKVDMTRFALREGGKPSVWVTTTQLSSGLLQAFGPLGSPRQLVPAIGISGDAVIRRHPRRKLTLVLNRFPKDNIQFVDELSGKTNGLQCSVGQGTNLKDVYVASDDTLYVSRHGSADLLRLDVQEGRVISRINLARYADADELPEMNWMTATEQDLYVSLQRLDAKTFATTNYSSVVRVDLRTDRVLSTTPLSVVNPEAEPLIWEGRLYVASVGSFDPNTKDGQIESFRLPDLDDRQAVVREQNLGGNILDFDFVDKRRAVAVIDGTSLVAFDPQSGNVIRDLLTVATFRLSHVRVDRREGRIYVSDMDKIRPAIRAFDAATFTELAMLRIDVLLPPIHFGLNP